MCLGEKLEKEEKGRESAQKSLENLFLFFFLQNERFGGIYSEKVTLQLLTHLVGLPC